MNPSTLTPLQQRFCDEYLIDINGKAAALRAGYSAKNAASQASQLLKKPQVQQYLADKRAAMSEELNIAAKEILQEYARIAFFDIRTMFDDNKQLIPLSDLPTNTSAAVAAMDVYEKYVGHGDERIQAGRVVKVHLHSKLAALDALAKHLGLFDKDNKQNRQPQDTVVYIGKTLISRV